MKIPSILFNSKYRVILKEKIEKIINVEKEYLLYKHKDENDFRITVERHNKNINNIALEIDEIIYNALDIDDKNQILIENFLFIKELFNLKDDELS